MTGYICRHCKFRTNKEKMQECPWCGRDTLEKEGSAEDLLNEVNNIINE